MSKTPWWRYHPGRGCGFETMQLEPLSHQQPVFQVGDEVRLRAKPERLRRVTGVVWHRWCHEWVYTVQSSSGNEVPYWFAQQLIRESEG